MQRVVNAGACALVFVLGYIGIYAATAKPKYNKLFGSGYDSFEYPKIPSYGIPDKIRGFGHRSFGVDPEEIADALFRPAFEMDRQFVRTRLWGGSDYRDIMPVEDAVRRESPMEGVDASRQGWLASRPPQGRAKTAEPKLKG